MKSTFCAILTKLFLFSTIALSAEFNPDQTRRPILPRVGPLSDFILASPEEVLDKKIQAQKNKLTISLDSLFSCFDNDSNNDRQDLEIIKICLFGELDRKEFDGAIESIAEINQILGESKFTNNSKKHDLVANLIDQLETLKKHIQDWQAS
ncbi:MAG: hypothetical protein AB8G05_25895 [Oligoflexales bacterium]